MKITRQQLKSIVKKTLFENTLSKNNDINITMDVPKREGVTFSVKAIGTRIVAILESEEGHRRIGDNDEDKKILLGILRATLETTSKEDTKEHLVRLIARLTGESESEIDMPAMMSKILNDRSLASYSQHIQDKNTRLV